MPSSNAITSLANACGKPTKLVASIAHFPIVMTKFMPQNQKLHLVPPIVSGNIKIHSSSLKLCPSRYH